MIDFKGVSIPLISLGIFEVRVSILARSCSDVKQFFRLCCLCAELLVLERLLVLTPRGQRMCLPQRASIRCVRGGNGQPLSRWLPLALQVPGAGI